MSDVAAGVKILDKKLEQVLSALAWPVEVGLPRDGSSDMGQLGIYRLGHWVDQKLRDMSWLYGRQIDDVRADLERQINALSERINHLENQAGCCFRCEARLSEKSVTGSASDGDGS
jgi:hypothetical protein